MVAGLAAKDIPQTGSITVSTALCRARIVRAISAAVLAPRSRPAGLCRRALRLVDTQRGAHRCAASCARDECDVGNAGAEGSLERRFFVPTVRGHDEGRVAGGGVGGEAVGQLHLQPEAGPELGERPRGRGGADDDDAGRGEVRLEEDFDRAAAQARVRDLHRSLLTRVGRLARHDPQQ